MKYFFKSQGLDCLDIYVILPVMVFMFLHCVLDVIAATYSSTIFGILLVFQTAICFGWLVVWPYYYYNGLGKRRFTKWRICNEIIRIVTFFVGVQAVPLFLLMAFLLQEGTLLMMLVNEPNILEQPDWIIQMALYVGVMRGFIDILLGGPLWILAALVDGLLPGAFSVELRSFIALWIAVAFFGFLILLTWMASTLKQLPDWTYYFACCAFGATCIVSLSAAIMLIRQLTPCVSCRKQGMEVRSTVSMPTQGVESAASISNSLEKVQEHVDCNMNTDPENIPVPSTDIVEITTTQTPMSTFWSRYMLETPWTTLMQILDIGNMWFSQTMVDDMSECSLPTQETNQPMQNNV
jgi:hypothetical protein